MLPQPLPQWVCTRRDDLLPNKTRQQHLFLLVVIIIEFCISGFILYIRLFLAYGTFTTDTLMGQTTTLNHLYQNGYKQSKIKLFPPNTTYTYFVLFTMSVETKLTSIHNCTSFNETQVYTKAKGCSNYRT
jgi:hypothetical protein